LSSAPLPSSSLAAAALFPPLPDISSLCVCASYRAGKKNTGPPHYYDSFDRLLAFFWFGWSFTVLSGIQTPCFIKIKFKKKLFFLYTILKIILKLFF
jgi:hypothetical protein